MLPTTSNAEDLVVKWLTIPVGHYLAVGSPLQDYTQEKNLFIKSYQFDNDVGQQFNNFLMHKNERHSHGVRFYHTKNDGSYEPQSFLRWCVLNFGCTYSPYLAVQGEERVMELCMGDRKDEANPFQWETVHINCPWDRGYDCSMPQVLLL